MSSMLSTSNRPTDLTTAQRFEAKYIINELQACEIIDYIEPYVASDRHTAWGKPYPLTSLYLDTPDLRLHWSSKLGEKNRMKLRIRTYDGTNEAAPVFFEIKRRVNQVILKQRATMARSAVPKALRGERILPEEFLKEDARERNNFYEFRDLMEGMAAEPRAMVHYTREAYVSNLEEPVRITFDRHLAALPCKQYSHEVWRHGPHWCETDVAPVILEIKFTDVFPAWVARMIQRFQLPRSEFAKYVVCVDMLKKSGHLTDWPIVCQEDPLWSSVI